MVRGVAVAGVKLSDWLEWIRAQGSLFKPKVAHPSSGHLCKNLMLDFIESFKIG